MSGHSEPRLPESAEWFDLWHVHIDFHGEEGRRQECLRSLFAAWARVEQLASGLKCGWQSWVLIDPEDPDRGESVAP
jgi:hypothetical protein